MDWRILQTGPPAVEPLDRDLDVKPHIRVDIAADDALLDQLIPAARQHLEEITSRAFIEQEWELTLDRWPKQRYIRLPRPPLLGAGPVRYADVDGNVETLTAGTDYIVDTTSTPGRIVLREGVTWPSVTLWESGGIVIDYVAGYGDAAAAVPTPLRQALKLLIGAWYENREDYYVGRTAGVVVPLPRSIEALIASYIVRGEYP